MKKIILIACLAAVMFAVGFTANTHTGGTQTEEYAIVDVVETGKKKFIRTTVGNEPATEKEWIMEKTEIRSDFSPVMKELTELNKRGFKLLNTSTTYTTQDGGQITSYGSPRFTFVMVRKME